jgi:hypothetical protein
MHRHTLVAAAGLLLLSSPLAGQTPPLFGSEREPPTVHNAVLSITPYFGLRSPLVSDRQATVVLPGRHPIAVDLTGERRGGGIAGAEAELRFGPIGFVASLAASNPDHVLVTSETPSGAISQVSTDGASVYLARAAISYRFAEPHDEDGMRKYRPAAYIAVGPAIVREDYSGDGLLSLGDDDDDIVDNWALAVSLKGIQPLGSRHVALHFGIEDYITFWNTDDAERARLERFLDLQPGTVLDANFNYDETHIFLVHIGLSFRL